MKVVNGHVKDQGSGLCPLERFVLRRCRLTGVGCSTGRVSLVVVMTVSGAY